MQRAIIFSHFDSQNIIEDYVVYYLKELKKSADKIIFVSDNNLNQNEIDKISGIVNHTICKNHGEYDFGSYKRGYLYLKETGSLNNTDELFFINDSCFGPLYFLENVFNNFKNCDFWGMNISENPKPHIQSFFIGFKKQVFNSSVFDDFMCSIKKEQNKDDIIENYEIGLSTLLIERGFTFGSFLNSTIERKLTGDIFNSKEINPLIKTLVFKSTNPKLIKFLFKNYFKKRKINYPLDLILSYLQNKKFKTGFLKDIKTIVNLIFRFQPKKKGIYIINRWYKI